MKVAFNTGAHYTTHGQRIAAWAENNFFCFVDFDRGIEGSFNYKDYGMTATDFARHVLYMYNYNQYGLEMPFYQKLRDVAKNGYDAFITDKEVKVLNIKELR